MPVGPVAPRARVCALFELATRFEHDERAERKHGENAGREKGECVREVADRAARERNQRRRRAAKPIADVPRDSGPRGA
jgi:hypothetical protein